MTNNRKEKVSCSLHKFKFALFNAPDMAPIIKHTHIPIKANNDQT